MALAHAAPLISIFLSPDSAIDADGDVVPQEYAVTSGCQPAAAVFPVSFSSVCVAGKSTLMPDEMRSAVAGRPAKRIVLVDPHTFVRECVAQCLRMFFEDAVVVSFTTIDECLHQGGGPRDVAFVLYNVHQRRPSDPQVEQHLKQLKETFGQVPLILLSDEDGPDRIFEALERGARGYIPPNATLEVAIGATRLVFAGGTFIPASSFATLASKQRSTSCVAPITEQFTHRQFAVLKCLRQGKANRAIAAELGMSEGTVKAHVRNIMQKLNATNRTQVVFLTREIFGDTSD